MEELGLGPNGALLYCMEYLVRVRALVCRAHSSLASCRARRRTAWTIGCKTC